MKHIKVFSLIATAILLSALVSCNKDSSRAVKIIDDYTVLIYANAPWSSGSVPEYEGERLYNYESYEKSKIPNKQVDLFGNNLNLSYIATTKFYQHDCEVDRYSAMYDAENDLRIYVYYNTRTGKIAKYETEVPCVDRNYKSDVNPQSSEKDFLAYASGLLSKHAGISTEGWQVKIVTEIKNETPISQFEDGFVNNSKNDPDFNAGYTFIYYKTIDGIDRIDNMRISMTNCGEISLIDALNAQGSSSLYEPFADIKIDREKIISAVESAFSHVHKYPIISHNITLKAIPTATELWIEATVEFKYRGGEDNEMGSGIKYVIKVAELK